MSQSSTKTSPSKSSPQKSPPQTTTTVPNITENLSVPLSQPSSVITDATPLTMIHPSFNAILNPTPSNPSSLPKSKTTKRTKSVITRKPKNPKSKSRYSSNFNMQELYLSDLGNASTNVPSDVATPSPDIQTGTNTEDCTQTLDSKKGETAEVAEQDVSNTSTDDNADEETQNIKIAEDALKSLVGSGANDGAVPDAPASLAQDKSQDEMADDVVADSPMQQEEGVTGAVNTDNVMSVEDNINYETADEEEGAKGDDSTEDDVTIMKIVSDSRRKGGRTGVGSRLRERKTITEGVIEEPKSSKKKKVAAEATKSPKKKKVASEAATSTKKKKMYGPVRRSSRVEIPAKQKQQGSKRKTINLSDSESDAEKDAPPISTASKQKTPKKRKTAAAVSADDAVVMQLELMLMMKEVTLRSWKCLTPVLLFNYCIVFVALSLLLFD
ncbi:hypothetical protein QL285_045488 [Trifolium repens]|nr:hypothetical protein QL285_045488 [Trifolium repens]